MFEANLIQNQQKALKQSAILAVITLTLPFWFHYVGGYGGLDTKIIIWALFALGFDILLGMTGYLSFGHAAFFGTAAYATGLTFLHWTTDVFVGLVVGIIAAGILALMIGYITLRRTGIYFSILTLAFGEMLHKAALSIFSDYTGGDNGLTGLEKATFFGHHMSDQAVYYFCTIILIIGFYFAMRLNSSPFGLMLRAVKSNAVRMQYTGLDIQKYKNFSFFVSAVYAGIAGSLMVIYEPYVAVEYLHWATSGEVVIMSVIGGVGTLIGPMIGAVFVQYFENVVAAFLEDQWLLILGLVFMVMVAFIPGGLIELYNRLLAKITKKEEPSS